MELTNIHPAEAYLRNEQNPSFLYIRIYGERRKLFINRGGENAIGIIAKGKRKRGYIFTDWDNIEKIYAPSQDNEKDRNRKLLVGSALGALPHFCGRFPRACPRTVLTCLHVHGSPL